MSGRLQGKRALVTGATSNIGRAIAEAFAAEGAHAGGGAIINLGSWIARLGVPVGALYGSTKGAMVTLTRAWAAEFGARGGRGNAISPGVILEPVPDAPNPGEVMMHGTPAGSLGKPQAVAHAAVYLAAEESAFVHGITLDVDGGRTATAVIAA